MFWTFYWNPFWRAIWYMYFSNEIILKKHFFESLGIKVLLYTYLLKNIGNFLFVPTKPFDFLYHYILSSNFRFTAIYYFLIEFRLNFKNSIVISVEMIEDFWCILLFRPEFRTKHVVVDRTIIDCRQNQFGRMADFPPLLAWIIKGLSVCMRNKYALVVGTHVSFV